LGQRQTPPLGPETFQIIGQGPRVIVLGLGPDPSVAVSLARNLKPRPSSVTYVEYPALAEQMNADWTRNLPEYWQNLDGSAAEALIRNLNAPQEATFILYLPGLRLFPSFFGPLFGAVWALFQRRSGCTSRGRGPVRSVTLVGSEQDLLQRELRLAFAKAGLKVNVWNPKRERDAKTSGRAGLSVPPEESLGDLFFSVNFKGLDPFGATYHYLRARDITVAVWCVDNPWHLLSGLRAPYWRETPLFVTDAAFLPGLKAHGAKQTVHLPLGTCPELFALPNAASLPSESYLRDLAPLVFVGRTAFPDRGKFFAAQRLPDALLKAGLDSLISGSRPDFLYWVKSLGLASLWPGQNARQAGLAAEECARRRRMLCVRAAARHIQNPAAPGITIFGDEAWTDELADIPGLDLDLRAPVDYYTQLPAVYQTADLTLNVTSLLLPAGLNQRHFDVWISGAAQIFDNSPGLNIFPQELTRPLVFEKPDDIPTLAAKLLNQPAQLRDLKHDWQAIITAEHTYTQRIHTVLSELE
jgi:hypothetical protein